MEEQPVKFIMQPKGQTACAEDLRAIIDIIEAMNYEHVDTIVLGVRYKRTHCPDNDRHKQLMVVQDGDVVGLMQLSQAIEARTKVLFENVVEQGLLGELVAQLEEEQANSAKG
jgi:hypothetical protein